MAEDRVDKEGLRGSVLHHGAIPSEWRSSVWHGDAWCLLLATRRHPISFFRSKIPNKTKHDTGNLSHTFDISSSSTASSNDTFSIFMSGFIIQRETIALCKSWSFWLMSTDKQFHQSHDTCAAVCSGTYIGMSTNGLQIIW